jgi:hypothetical protein
MPTEPYKPYKLKDVRSAWEGARVLNHLIKEKFWGVVEDPNLEVGFTQRQQELIRTAIDEAWDLCMTALEQYKRGEPDEFEQLDQFSTVRPDRKRGLFGHH